MEIANSAIEMKQINKKYRGFTLDIPSLSIPEGFAPKSGLFPFPASAELFSKGL